MRKKPVLAAALLSVIVAAPGCRMSTPGTDVSASELSPAPDDAAAPRNLTLAPDDRIIIFAPHPDDEALGCAGVIQQAVSMKVPVRIVWLTYGDSNELSFILYRKRLVIRAAAERAMGEVRHVEAVAAARVLGVPEVDLAFLGYPDFGTLRIWCRHWGDSPPYRSILTKVREVPYASAFRPGAPYKGEEIVRDIKANLSAFKPTKVFVSHPSDLNMDHQGLYLYVRTALWDLESEMRPELHPFLIHCSRWPAPAGLHAQELLLPPERIKGAIAWRAFPLTAGQQERQVAALRAHRSQMAYSEKFMLSFVRANELFGDLPAVSLSSAPADDPAGSGSASTASGAVGELAGTDRALFVGLEKVRTWREANTLAVDIRFSRPLTGEEVSATVFSFGYRSGCPFERMPKLRVELNEIGHRVFDQTRKLPADAVQVRRQSRELTVRIPLGALGNPQRVLLAVHTTLAGDPLDSADWQVLELTPPL